MHRDYKIKKENPTEFQKFEGLNIKKLVFILTCLILALICLFGLLFFNKEKRNTQHATKKIRIAEATRSVFYAPQYVADSLGFFKKRGIIPEFITSDGSDKTMTAVLSHGAEIGLAGAEMVFYVKKEGMKNHPIIFSQLTRKDGSYLIGRDPNFQLELGDHDKEKIIQSLRGKSIISGRPGGLPFMSLEYALKDIDICNDVTLLSNIKFELMAPSFSSGMADYVMLFEPAATKLIESQNAVRSASLGDIIGETCYTCYFANPTFIQENSDLVQNFVESIHEGQNWVKNHEVTEIAEKIERYFPDSDKKILIKSLENYKKLGVWSENPLVDKESFEKTMKIVGISQKIVDNFEFEEFVNNTFAEKSMKEFESGGENAENSR